MSGKRSDFSGGGKRFTRLPPRKARHALNAVNLNPRVNKTHEHVTVKQGGRVLLPCTVEHLGENAVIWVNPRKTVISLKDSRVIDDHRISVERPFTSVWNLLIRSVRYNDSGTYECRINTTPVQIKLVSLEVQVPPAIISEASSDKIEVQEGETATLICNVTGIPLPNVTWYKRNYKKPDDNKERIGQEGEVLIIHNVTRHCDDIYECFVDNGVPPAVSKAIRVMVNFPPEVEIPSPRRIGQHLHKETILECTISANPQGVTMWRKHGQVLSKSNKYETDIYSNRANSVTLALRIRNLTKEDFGRYECSGSNFLGEDRDYKVLYQVIPTTTTSTTTTTTTKPVPRGHNGHDRGNSGKVYDTLSNEYPHPRKNQKGRYYGYTNTASVKRPESKGTAPNNHHYSNKHQQQSQIKDRNPGAASWNSKSSDGKDGDSLRSRDPEDSANKPDLQYWVFALLIVSLYLHRFV